MTNDELLALLARLLRKRGLRVKEWSEAYVANKVRGEGDEPNTATINQRLKEMAREESVHFAPLEGMPTPNSRERAVSDLERVNAAAHATRPKGSSQKIKLTPAQRAWVKRHGAPSALDIANGDAPDFEDETNEDE